MAVTSRFIAALTEAMIPLNEIDLAEEDRRLVLNEASDFVRGQVDALPPRLALMFAVGTAFFRFYVRATRFHGFCDLPSEVRRNIVESWAYGPISLFRALFKLIRTTALLSFFEAPPVRAALDRGHQASESPAEGAA